MMEFPSIIGWSIVGLALSLITFLVFLSGVIIRRIARDGHNSLREILKKRRGGPGDR
jgi:hypothetical protein